VPLMLPSVVTLGLENVACTPSFVLRLVVGLASGLKLWPLNRLAVADESEGCTFPGRLIDALPALLRTEDDLCREGACVESLSFAEDAFSFSDCPSSCDVESDEANDGPAARERLLSDLKDVMRWLSPGSG
jgi:hypothetical protein